MLIDEYKGRLPVARMSALLGISRGAYYHFKAVEASRSKDLGSIALEEEIVKIKQAFKAYGYRRVQAELKRRGTLANYKKVLHIMREAHLLAIATGRHLQIPQILPQSVDILKRAGHGLCFLYFRKQRRRSFWFASLHRVCGNAGAPVSTTWPRCFDAAYLNVMLSLASGIRLYKHQKQICLIRNRLQ